MSGLYGTTQAYNPIAGTYLALAPNCGDKLFGTNIDYCNLVKWGIYDGQENDPEVLKQYLKQRDSQYESLFQQGVAAEKTTSPTSYSMAPSNRETTVWSLLSSMPQFSTFKKIIEKSDWFQYINQANDLYKITLFVPNNKAFEKNGWQNLNLDSWNKNNLRAIAQGHTLPFAFQQDSAYNRKLRLYTALETFSVYIDGTGEVSPKLNFYVPPDKMLNLRYPNPLKRINVLQGYYTNNGALYEIDGVFEPEVIVY